MRRLIYFLTASILFAAGCAAESSDDKPAPKPKECAALAESFTLLKDLEQFGQKGIGDEAGAAAADYLFEKFDSLALDDVQFSDFGVPVWRKLSSSAVFTSGDQTLEPNHEVFSFTSVGNQPVSADLVYLGLGDLESYEGIDVTGKAVMVDRSVALHRSSQYSYIIAAGGVAMVYISETEGNHVQIGTAGEPFDGGGAIPSITVGADDGAKLIELAESAEGLYLEADVKVEVVEGRGKNIIGQIPGGKYSDYEIIVGGHFDTWFAGSIDNGTGVVAVLRIAEILNCLDQYRPNYTITFVEYDGEEVGLYGSYDYLVKNYARRDKMVAVFNMEMPASTEGEPRLMAVSDNEAIKTALDEAGAYAHYNLAITIPNIQQFSGGIIPTDIQSFYFAGINGMTTFSNTPYYHTPLDTPEKVDIVALDAASRIMADAIMALDRYTPEKIQAGQETLIVDAEAEPTSGVGADIRATFRVADPAGAPLDYEQSSARLFYDGFITVASAEPTRLDTGSYEVIFPGASIERVGRYTIDIIAGADLTGAGVTNGEAFAFVEVK